MDSEKGSDLPCKKLRTMFPATDGETGEGEGTSGTLLSDSETGLSMEVMGPDGDQNRGQSNKSCEEMGPGISGDRPLDIVGSLQSAGHTHSVVATSYLELDVSRSSSFGPEVSKRVPTHHQYSENDAATGTIWGKNTAAIAENAYIKKKETEQSFWESGSEVYSGVPTNPRRQIPVASTSSRSDGDMVDSSLIRQENVKSDKIISFDRADFEFDFYGAPTRQEEDGTLINQSTESTDYLLNQRTENASNQITPPERMNDTGFIEMFSNSVMGTVLNQNSGDISVLGGGDAIASQMREYNIRCSSGMKYKLVKQPNVPFILDSVYVNQVVSQQNINSLPQTLLVHIFKSLSPYVLLRKVGLVCKYWYNVSRDPALWREINFRNQYRLSDAALSQMLEFSDRVLKVNLTDCRFVTDSGIRRLILRCQHIQTLKLMRCFDLTDSSFAGMGAWHLGTSLRTLHLDGCCRLTDSTVIEIAEACPFLSSLHLNQCTKITDAGVMALAQHCHGLKQLLLDHCCKVTDKGLSELVLGCPAITYLNIMSCGVTDPGIKQLSKLSNLTNLDVSNVPLMSPAAIEYVSRFCKKLDCVNVSLNAIIDDNCVAEVVKNLPNLLRLYCVSCSVTDKGLEDIAQHRPSLRALDVGWCQDVTDQGVRVISHACRHLDYFGLIRCDKVTVEAVEELVLKFPTVNYSTFILESRRLLERARKEGYQFGL